MRLNTRRQRMIISKTLTYLVLTVITAVLVFPFLWMVSTSFKPANEIFVPEPRWIPSNPILDNYRSIWSDTCFPVYLKNSLIITLATTLVAMLVALLAGYAISRFQFRGRTVFSAGLIVVQVFPSMILAIPMFVIMRNLGLLNTHLALVIAYGSFAFPFCTWMLKGYIDTIPVSLEEAARIDGCNTGQVISKILIPTIGPGLVTVAMFAFILAWQEYLFALTFTRTESMRTVTVGLSMMQGMHGSINWGQIMAGSVIACLPPLIFFFFIEQYIVSGFTMGAVKG